MAAPAILVFVVIAFLVSRWSFRKLSRKGFRYPTAAGVAIFIVSMVAMLAGLAVVIITTFDR